MGKVTFEFDDKEESYDVSLCTNRYVMAHMLDEISNYARGLRKYEERSQVPTEEVETKLSNIIDKWYVIQD